jgi:hypothetical protein
MMNGELQMMKYEIQKKLPLNRGSFFNAFDFDYNSEWDPITNKKQLLDPLDNS